MCDPVCLLIVFLRSSPCPSITGVERKSRANPGSCTMLWRNGISCKSTSYRYSPATRKMILRCAIASAISHVERLPVVRLEGMLEM